MSNKFKLIKLNKCRNAKIYLFECEPQKRTISIYEYDKNRYVPYRLKHISLNKHWFRIATINNFIVAAHMGKPHEHKNYKYLTEPYNFNGYSFNIYCGHPPYENMHFTEEDFSKFLSMFWQAGFISYADEVDGFTKFSDFDVDLIDTVFNPNPIELELLL